MPIGIVLVVIGIIVAVAVNFLLGAILMAVGLALILLGTG